MNINDKYIVESFFLTPDPEKPNTTWCQQADVQVESFNDFAQARAYTQSQRDDGREITLYCDGAIVGLDALGFWDAPTLIPFDD